MESRALNFSGKCSTSWGMLPALKWSSNGSHYWYYHLNIETVCFANYWLFIFPVKLLLTCLHWRDCCVSGQLTIKISCFVSLHLKWMNSLNSFWYSIHCMVVWKNGSRDYDSINTLLRLMRLK
jgi:hypothetical protein